MPLHAIIDLTGRAGPSLPSARLRPGVTVRIGIDARLADYTVGGIARYTVQLVDALHRLDGDHELVGIRSRRPKVSPPELATHQSVAVHTPPRHRLEHQLLSWELRGARLQVLHSPDFIPPGRRGWRSVITVHDLAFLRFPHLVTSQSRRYYSNIRHAVREADAIIAVSHATAQDLAELTDAPAERIHVVHEAADPVFAPMPVDEATRLVRERFELEPPYILFVGTLEPRKNLPTLLQAFALVRRELPARLVLAGGKGWLSDEVFTAVQQLALADGVSFLGEVSPADLRPLYCAADALALPSWYEGFGLPPLEAMACGTPVVVSNAGALPEIVGDAGMIVRPDDPKDIAEGLGWVLGNVGFREALIQRGLARAATFSWDRAAQQTLAIYEQAIA